MRDGTILQAAVRSLNWDGRAITVGYAGGVVPKIPANILLVKNVAVSGLYWGAHLRARCRRRRRLVSSSRLVVISLL